MIGPLKKHMSGGPMSDMNLNTTCGLCCNLVLLMISKLQHELFGLVMIDTRKHKKVIIVKMGCVAYFSN